jgi:alkanesulfonate monooxygenase SsuD/methylene tetrahydromethanopterin reductase-like flavin-dependent oxidoreductase (luciferase family)
MSSITLIGTGNMARTIGWRTGWKEWAWSRWVPPIWIGGAGEAAMRRVGRSGVGWLGVDGPAPAASISSQDEGAGRLWSIARRAAQDAGRDPDALKTAMRINLEPGTSVGSLADKLQRHAESGVDEAYFDAFAVFTSLDRMLDFAGQVIARTGRL